ncbi:uncharacterized protein EKO05_0002912 [Ascochyta rabiei]|uniref:uncharacterized protein n=1 Tax=Didymella rabiei TaxID=5454 RepID=UPI00220FB590|nr:uncharacterized protein EKO05_0002912 [Ascochyta rabiei]UPX12362.1 hypothetical protein EKO05_0002912 [Ascochyta rabiei]
MPSLCDLPDEILLEVVRCLQAIRSYETQSVAFRHKGTEKGRQRENHVRQQTLHALCLTSHRLRCISLPTLYASSITCASWGGFTQLRLFHRTISSPEKALGQSTHLAKHVQYVENRLADYLGNSLQEDEIFREKSAFSYFHLLSKVVLCAPNLENLCVVSLEHGEVSFWDHLLPQPHPSSHLEGHGLGKLRYLTVQIHAHAWSTALRLTVFERISLALQSSAMLSELRVSGASTHHEFGLIARSQKFSNLRRLDLTECCLEMDEVAEFLSACKDVRHFACRWAYLNGAHTGPSKLHTVLLARTGILESLTLDTREIRYNPNIQLESKVFGSLQPLRGLKSLEICETGFLDCNLSLLDFPDLQVNPKLSMLLPESLEHMTLLARGDYNSYDEDVLEEASCLRRLARDRLTTLLQLKTLCIVARHNLSAPRLVTAFKRAGLRFHIKMED